MDYRECGQKLRPWFFRRVGAFELPTIGVERGRIVVNEDRNKTRFAEWARRGGKTSGNRDDLIAGLETAATDFELESADTASKLAEDRSCKECFSDAKVLARPFQFRLPCQSHQKSSVEE